MGRALGASAAPAAILAGALALLGGTANRLRGEQLQPTFLGTRGLETVRAELAVEAELPWPFRLPDRKLRPGDVDDAVAALRERLAASGEGPAAPPVEWRRYDGALEAAVRGFQLRHGLDPDGVVGPATRAELDLGPADRLRQIDRVIAARRALPAGLGRRFVLVNLPAFTLEAVAAAVPELASRVIVGAPRQRTPTLASAARSVVVHPVWNVPARIARRELAPLAARDSGYLVERGFEVFAADGTTVEPTTVDWIAVQRGELRLRLRQRPGSLNALGVVGIQVPNPFDVRLHDTPDHRLFERARRDLSHGCIRVDRAVELARWLLADAPRPTRDELERALTTAATREIALAEPVPVYLVDWPVWVDPEGRLQMRPELSP